VEIAPSNLLIIRKKGQKIINKTNFMSVVSTIPIGIKPLGYEQLAVSDTAVALTVPPGTMRAKVCVEDQPIRWRDDGEDPTDAIGMLQKADTYFDLWGGESIKAFKAIKTGMDANLSINYYG
jgi:hypothetical protein